MAKKILVIDDEGLVTRSLQMLLKKQGYDAIIANSGQEAITICKSHDFDLIVSDVRMPQLDGIETIKKIRELQKELHKKPALEVFITGFSDEDSYRRALELGVTNYIYKPFDKDIFLEAIEKCLKLIGVAQCKDVKDVDNKALINNFIEKQSQESKKLLLNKAVPIIGWINTYVPEEIIIASGFLPYRIMGAPIPLHLSKAYLSGNLCSSAQSILECALRGDYKFLDGLIIGASTDATKRLYDAWIRYGNASFCHLFDMPKFINEEAFTHYLESARLLIEEIEKYFKVKISNSKILEAISICNKTRQLLSRLNNLRRQDNPSVASQQFLEICKLAMVSDKRDFNISLESLLLQLKPEDEKKAGSRILLTGSFQDQAWLLDIIEEKGGIVVCEDFCTRLRYFSGLIEDDSDSIKAIAKRYLNLKPASANLVSLDKRVDYLLDLVKEFNIDGVIYYILKFDDAYLFEYPDIKEVFSLKQIPVLRVETEHNTSAMGQIMTRVQAFMETLKLAKAKQMKTAVTGKN